MDETTISVSRADYGKLPREKLSPAFLAVAGEVNGQLYPLADGENGLGRHPANHVVLESTGVSRFHCTVDVFDDQVTICDRGSSNGTFVNQRRLNAPVVLNSGDLVNLGGAELRYLAPDAPERYTYELLRQQADTDPLTLCFNKGYLSRALNGEFCRALTIRQPLSVLMFDLDHFKVLNDTYGHAAGDQVLKTVAELITKRVIRVGDTFARFGGEEFVVLLPSTTLADALVVGERLRQTVDVHRFVYNGAEMPVSVSVGAADLDPQMASAQALLESADEALYAAKDAGRNRVASA